MRVLRIVQAVQIAHAVGVADVPGIDRSVLRSLAAYRFTRSCSEFCGRNTKELITLARKTKRLC